MVRLSVLNPEMTLALIGAHWSRRHRSVSTRFVKSTPPTTRTPSQLWGRQFAVPLPMKRSMSWFTVSEKNWSGVYRR